LSDTSIVHLAPSRRTSREGELEIVGPSFSVNPEGSSEPLFSSSSSVGSGSDTHETGRSGGSTSTSRYPSNDDPLVTFRFEHREDDDGHHVVVGREGKLSRCEDEVRASSFMYILLHLSSQTGLTESVFISP
jgi:hypothetical protein